MKWRWLAAFLIGLLVVAGGIYWLLDPETNELNEAVRAKLGGTYVRLSDGFTHYKKAINRFASLLGNHAESEKYTRLFVEQTTYKGFQQSILSMLKNDAVGDYRDAYQIVGRQKRDMLLIWGTEETGLTKPMISDIQSFVPRLTFKPVDGANHGIVFQKPDIVNQLIIDFL